MNTAITRSGKSIVRMSRKRGASMVEYALLLFGVLLVGAFVIKSLGAAVKTKAQSAADELK